MSNIKRTGYCADFSEKDINSSICLKGWVQTKRDLGNLIFIDLRDRSGIIQLAFDDKTEKAVFEIASECKSEYVISAVGTVRERSSKNPDIPTGAIEVFVTSIEILSKSETPPFEISKNCSINLRSKK